MKALNPLVPLVAVLVLGHCPASAAASAPAPVSAPVPALVQTSVAREPVGVWPLSPTPVVVHDFDPPDSPWGSGHRGVDLAGSVGQSVHTSRAGVVAFTGHIAGKPVVTVSHGDTRTTYEPVSSDLKVGDRVAAGQRIGSLELAFSHCFPQPCLHWGWLSGETYLDPLDLVTSTRVRLLPLWRDLPAGQDNVPTPSRRSSKDPLQPDSMLPYAAWSPLLHYFLPRRLDVQEVRPADVPAGRPDAVDLW